jgi:FlgD Ig-like domain
MRRLQSILPFALLACAFTSVAGVRTADAALRHGRPPLSSGDTKGVNLLGEAQFECGTYKGNQVEHAWRKAVNERVQKEVRTNKRIVQGGLDYIYNDVWIIEDDGTLALSGTNAFDTNAKTFQFAPAGGGVFNITNPAFSYDAVLGTALAPGDDGAVVVALAFSFPYAGGNWNQMYVSGNGVISFGAAPNPSGFFDPADFYSTTPKLAGYYMDLDPSAGGTVRSKSEVTKHTITWSAVPQYATANLNTIQIVLYPSGNFTYTYNGIASTTSGGPLLGYHPGGTPSLETISFSADIPYASGAGAAVYEEYYSYANPLVNEVALMQRFYQQFPDEFFQLVFFTNFVQTMGGFANELNIKNDVTGIGLDIFDSSAQYGSNGVLESRCNMNRLAAWASSDPYNRWLSKGNNFLTIMGQEAGHRWGAFTYFDAGGGPSNLILGRSDAHWSYYVDVDHSSLEGGNWVSTGGTNYVCPTQIDYFSELDEYLFGLRTPDEVKDFFYISSASNNLSGNRSVGTPILGAVASGTLTPVTVEHIIAAEGVRTPVEAAENKDLRQGFILLVQAGTSPSQADLDKVAGFRSAWEDYFEKSCDGRLTCNTSLTSNYAVAVICGNVRERWTGDLIPEFTARSLERGFDQHVPDDGRYTFRYQANGSSGPAEDATIVFTAAGYEPDTLEVSLTYGTTTCIDAELMVDQTTGTEETPSKTELFANHPNPFNPSTTIRYSLGAAGHVQLVVFDTAGRRVRSLVNATESAGGHEVTFDGRDDKGGVLASGVYFYRLEAGGVAQTRKMVLLK